MRNRNLQPAQKTIPTVQKAFEQFQKQNILKNLAPGTIQFYDAKARKLFAFLEDEEYLEFRGREPSEPLFVSEYGNTLTVSALGNAVWAYNHKRGVEKTSVHLFRHTYAKLYIQAGGDPFRLQKLMGH